MSVKVTPASFTGYVVRSGCRINHQGKRRLASPGVFRSIEPAWNDQNLRELAGHIRSHLPIGDLPGAWVEMPEASYAVASKGGEHSCPSPQAPTESAVTLVVEQNGPWGVQQDLRPYAAGRAGLHHMEQDQPGGELVQAFDFIGSSGGGSR